jgi:hypothetical protein
LLDAKAMVRPASLGLVLAFLAACGGEVGHLGVQVDAGAPHGDAVAPRVDSSPPPPPIPDARVVDTSVGPVDGAITVDGQTCLDLVITPEDTACNTDQDCMLGVAGVLCAVPCGCNSTPLNETAAAVFASAIANFGLPPPMGCPGGCPDFGQPRCLGGQCTLCRVGEENPPGCIEDAGEPDVATTSDAGQCVTIDPTTFTQSCSQAIDCMPVVSGQVCSGACACGQTAAINVEGQSAYEEDIAGITFAECHCLSAAVRCVSGLCETCPAGAPCPP